MKKEVPFDKQTKSQKRVTIAKDVLAQLARKRFLATQGTYLSRRIDAVNLDAEVCSITSKHKSCEVCALGGMFVAAVEKADKLKVFELSEVYGGEATLQQEDCRDYLARFFDEEQLMSIESAFEEDDFGDADAAGFTDCEDPPTRMRLIMENIVANRGRFKPSRKPIVTYTTPGY